MAFLSGPSRPVCGPAGSGIARALLRRRGSRRPSAAAQRATGWIAIGSIAVSSMLNAVIAAAAHSAIPERERRKGGVARLHADQRAQDQLLEQLTRPRHNATSPAPAPGDDKAQHDRHLSGPRCCAC